MGDQLLFREQAISRQANHKTTIFNAINYARKNGAIAIEAYPKDMTHATKRDKDRSLYFGTTKMFKEAGFEEVIRRHPSFPIMRLWL